MKNLKLIALTLVVTQCVLQSVIAKPTREEYWDQTSFKFDAIREKISTESCYQSDANFIGCMAALNTMFSFAQSENILVTEDRMKDYGELQKDFGALKWVVVVEKPDLPIVEAIQRSRKMRRDNFDSLIELYKKYEANPEGETKAKIDFDEMIKFVESDINPKVKSISMMSGYAYNAYLSVIVDPHTRIQPIQEFEDDSKPDANDFVGIGVAFRKINKQFRIINPIENGPAHQAGLKSGDIIVQVDDQDVSDLESTDLMKKIRGIEGTEVKLLIVRGDLALEFKIVRGKIIQPPVEAKIVKQANSEKNIGYIKLRSFIPNVCKTIKENLDRLIEQKAEAFVLDLRNNGGGLIDEAVCVAGVFVGEGIILRTKSLINGREQPLLSREKQRTKAPLVTLINAGSASASEIVSGALQDWQRSYIVGDRSYGKGSAQAVYRDPNYAGMYRIQTKDRFYLPSKRTNQIVGILPDFQTFSAPEATDEDKIASREEDEYFNPLPPEGQPYTSPRPEALKKIKDCVDQTGKATTTFNENQNASLAPDYQLLYAEDVLACAP